MRMVRFATALVLAAFLSTGLAAVLAQQADLDRELEEAKALYREAKFAQALAKLQEIITRMRALQDLQMRKAQLADAYLHLALSYLALNDPLAAKDTLKQMLRVDRDRRLDPEVYAPKVIELFEQARADVATEPAPAAQVPPKSAPAAAEPKKKGSRLPYVLIGAGGAAAGGLAAASGGGGGPTTTAPPAPALTTTTTTSVPVSTGLDDIVFLSSDPPPGGTISVGGSGNFRMVLSVIYSRSGNYVLSVHSFRPADRLDWSECDPGHAPPGFALIAGQPMAVELFPQARPTSSCLSRLPVTTVEFTAFLHEGTSADSQTPVVMRRIFTLSWTWVR